MGAVRASSLLMCAPLTFDPSVVEMFGILSVGGTLVLAPVTLRLDAVRLVDTLVHQRVTLLMATPSLIRR